MGVWYNIMGTLTRMSNSQPLMLWLEQVRQFLEVNIVPVLSRALTEMCVQVKLHAKTLNTCKYTKLK